MLRRWAMVTGTDRGLGLALAEGLLNRGFRVLAGRYMEADFGLNALKQSHGDALVIVPLDIADAESVRNAANTVRSHTDRLDVLINNAAILGDIRSTVRDELEFEEMDRVFRVNALGALRMSNALIEPILSSGSKLIVNISSEAGSVADCRRTSWFGYCMSKSALNMQSHLIHNEIRKNGGKVLVIHPGWVRTYMEGHLKTDAALAPAESADGILRIVSGELDPESRSEEFRFIDYAGQALPW